MWVLKRSCDGVHISIKVEVWKSFKLWSSFVNEIEIWCTVFKLQLLHVAIMFTRIQPGKRLNVQINFDWLGNGSKINRDWCLLLFIQNHGWAIPTIKNSGTYFEGNSVTSYIFLKDENGQINGIVYSKLPTIFYPCWKIGYSTDLKSQKPSLYYTYKN